MTMMDSPPIATEPTQDDVDAAWRAEIRRRIDQPGIQWIDADESDARIAAILAEN
jgi:hypothetical protein